MDMNAYLSMFIDESNDHLQALNENLLKLENDPQDLSIVQVIFRSAHTLKGMSATMGFEDLASLTHEMENVLDLVRNSKLSMDSFIFDTLFKGLDALEAMVQDVVEGGTGKADVSALIVSLQSIVKGDYKTNASAAPSAAANAAEGNLSSGNELLDIFQLSVLKQSIEAGSKAYYIKVTLREDCVLKAVRAYMVFDVLERNGEVIKSDPSVQDIEQDKFDRSFIVFLISSSDQQALKDGIESVSEVELAEVVLLDAESIQLYGPQNEQSPAPKAAAPSAVPQPQQEAKQQVAAAKAQTAAAATAPVNRTIRVDIDRLDSLMNLFSELLIDRVRLEQLSSEIKRGDLSETVEHMARVSTDLQDIVLKLRMVPVESVFNRFPRMVRDIAKNLDKKSIWSLPAQKPNWIAR